MPIKASCLVVFGLAAVFALAPAVAQVPDCTGISDASNFDGPAISDFAGRLSAVLVASGLLSPNYVTSPPGDVDRLFIMEQDGKIKILRDGVVLGTPFLDITDDILSPLDGGHNEEGLLGLAFHPDYASNGWFFIYHTNDTGSQNVVARYTVSANPDIADTDSREVVIALDHPDYGDQDGGMLAFNPLDGRLYVGTGDGGGECDPPDDAQSLDSNLGKILRLNVDSLPYTTTGNPFDGTTLGNDEIWSYGLRNPWRFSFDRLTGLLMIGDVGEEDFEEIDCQVPGSSGGHNYGWNRYEGYGCPSSSGSCASVPEECGVPAYTPPIRDYNHATAGFSCAINGGYVYRGCRMSDLHGTYFYADYCSWMIRTFRVTPACGTVPPGPGVDDDMDRTADLDPPGALGIELITSFGEDERGELYVIDRTGEVFKILPTLSVMEVSGLNAPALVADADGDWIWEDLEAMSGHPISSYKVYRSSSRVGPFVCVHGSAGPSWAGGDPAEPFGNGAFYYVVTALNDTGEQTRPGNHSSGTPRNVALGSTCP